MKKPVQPSGARLLGTNIFRAFTLIELLGTTSFIRSWIKTRHDGKLNVAFCDYHVEAIDSDRLMFEQSITVLRMWNRDHEAHAELIMNR